MNKYIFSRCNGSRLEDGAPRILSVSIDGETLDCFSPDTLEYSASIPNGRPRIPIFDAVAEDGATLNIYRPVFPDGENESFCKMTVKKDGRRSDYRFHLTKSAKCGFVLQYDDRYLFSPEELGENARFSSSAPEVISVDERGMLTALKRSDSPVTVSATAGGKSAVLTVDKVIKAQINFFFITGQSNAQGCLDKGLDREEQIALSERAYTLGRCYCVEVKGDEIIGEIYDLSRGRVGFSTPLTKLWYERTGEKSLAIQSAVGGSPIERWTPGYSHRESLLINTVYADKLLTEKFSQRDSDFEIYRRGYFWCQGETGEKHLFVDGGWQWNSPTVMKAPEYYEKFMKYHSIMERMCHTEFGAIVLVRCLASLGTAECHARGELTKLVSPRAAQYALNNTTDSSLFIASRVCDYAKPAEERYEGMRGYGYMGPENLHYTQIGYNAQGHEIADNLYAALAPDCDRAPMSIELLRGDGRTTIADGEIIEVGKPNPTPINDADQVNDRFAAITLPLYTDEPRISYKVIRNEDICSVSMYGDICFSEDAANGVEADIEVRSESGIVRRFTVKLNR